MKMLSPEEIKTVYPKIFKEIFGFEPDLQLPRTVLVQERDNKIIGFVSGYLIDRENFYMAWGGTTKTFAGNRQLWRDAEAEFKSFGISYLQSRVENTDTNCQRMLMGIGWIPFGMKATQGKLFIDYYKEL
jgi:hypothetical protein